MTTIDIENAKQIRTPMQVVGGISAAGGESLTYSVDASKSFDNISLDDIAFPMRKVTDLQGDGYPLDGSCTLYDDTAPSSDGKMGLRSDIGKGFTVTITATSDIAAVTVNVTSGTGTVTYGGTTYDLAPLVVIPTNNARSIVLTFTNSDPERRIEIASIISGISMTFNNDNIVKCIANLRANLAPDNPTWQVSEIEFQVYYSQDIRSAISSIGDDAPLYYQAGYSGDMSPVRKFYISEAVTQENNVITMKGTDASDKLSNQLTGTLHTIPSLGRVPYMYNLMVTMIENEGIALENKETAPTASGSSSAVYFDYIKENGADDFISYFMNTWQDATATSTSAKQIGGKRFKPVFVDAGIPTVRWSWPTPKWVISEEDCEDGVSDGYARRYNKLNYETNTTSVGSYTTIKTLSVKAGNTYFVDLGNPYTYIHIVNCADFMMHTMTAVKFRASWTGTSIIKAKSVYTNENNSETTKTVSRAGIPLKLSYVTNAGAGIDSDVLANAIFNRSTHTGKFTFKGDPRMQPRDVFTFNRLDGTSQICTISTIEITHESGGTKAQIEYREGIC